MARKDSVELICSIGELAGLFEKTRNLTDFLQTVVNVVAFHMNAAVCSVYLLDEPTNELVLTANQGLNPQWTGRLRLKVGEGLTGLALQELRPISEGSVRRNPGYKYIPGLNEDTFESLLAVPILRGLQRVGVLVVQDPVRDYFDARDARALQAIATQLATTIENAKLLMSLRERDRAPAVVRPADRSDFFKGIGAAAGFAVGRATVARRTDSYLRLSGELAERTFAPEAFDAAVQHSEEQLEQLQRRLNEQLSDVASLIFSAHLLILKDEEFSGAMRRRVAEGLAPPRAVAEVVNRYVELLSRSANPRLREKVQDVKDVGHRLLLNLAAREGEEADYHGEVVIAGELLPSDVVKLAAQRAAALVMVVEGVTSHIAILARSVGIPVVMVADARVLDVPDGVTVLVDADQGNVCVNPDASLVERYRTLAADTAAAERLATAVRPETRTSDGTRVRLLATINLLTELSLAGRMKAEGVGLYRSEIPFIVRSAFPSEEEQYRIYAVLFRAMAARPVTLRTLDVGGDKMLSYYGGARENNPFLGLRALRFSLRNMDIFLPQVRAMLRAGEGGDLGIMFPMVSSVDEFVQARDLVREAAGRLAAQGVAHHPRPRIGAMVELPSAVEVADELAAEADFLCIGSNDLIQYVLAVDRTNAQLADCFVPYHPAVLRCLRRVAEAGARRGREVSVCGDMASDPRMIPFLLGIGVRTFSVNPVQMPLVQSRVEAVSLDEARRRSERMLAMGRLDELAAFLEAERS